MRALTCRLEFKLPNLWVGAFWKRDAEWVDLWVCLLPCLPLHYRWSALPRCQEPGCRLTGRPCGIIDPFSEELPREWYCSQHGDARGYCRGCGWPVWDGRERIHYHPGFCEECVEEMEREAERDREPDYEDADGCPL